MSQQDIEQIIIDRIKQALEDAQVQLRDLTGTRDHWEAVIVSTRFEGMRLIARQQAVYGALGELMAGPIHAFTMQTLTPAEAEERGVIIQESRSSNNVNDGLVTLS